jgi:acetyltransferase-like isoleucine patch superfamily enzyme
MNIKGIVKRLLTPITCFRWGIKTHGRFLYVGRHSKIVNGKRICFGNHVSIMPYNMIVCIDEKASLKIGENVEIGMFSRIACINRIELGKCVVTGPHVFIADFSHEYRDVSKPILWQDTPITSENRVVIGDETWLGTNVVISGKISIGKHCVIGANSVVTTDIPDYSVAAGIPARVIKRYNFTTECWEKVERISERKKSSM